MNSRTAERLKSSSRSVLLALLCASALVGCLSRAPLQKQSFSFAVPSGATNNAAASERVLGIRAVDIAPAYQGRLFVYRIGESSYERDPYAEFFVSPAESLLHAFRNYFRETGLFQSVTDAGSLSKPNLLAEVHVSQLYGDFRDLKAPAAVLRVRCAFFEVQADAINPKPLIQKSYARRIPFKTRTAAALMNSWNEGLKEILTEVTADLKGKLADKDAG